MSASETWSDTALSPYMRNTPLICELKCSQRARVSIESAYEDLWVSGVPHLRLDAWDGICPIEPHN